MTRWGLKLAIATSALTLVMGAASPSLATSGWKWAQSSTYGYQGQNVVGNGITVTDVAAYFVPPNRDYLSSHAWRFVITKYSCDPRGVSKSVCTVDSHWNSKQRAGNPPHAGQTCESLGIDGTGISDCQDYGLGSAYASHGDFPGFGAPRTFPSGSWLCTEIQINSNKAGTGTWHFNKDNQIGLRACAEVHS